MKDVMIACDFADKDALENFLTKMGDAKPFLKIGMELFYKEGAPMVKELKERGYKIFLDLKLHDIPNTVYKAMKNLALLGVDITNVHAGGGIEMMKWAKRALDEAGGKTKLSLFSLRSAFGKKHRAYIRHPGNKARGRRQGRPKESGDACVCKGAGQRLYRRRPFDNRSARSTQGI